MKNIANYIFELGNLKKFAHSGTKYYGVRHPDSIAEHVQRTAIIGYILAKLEKADAEKVMLMCLTHDNAEARITDLHKLARHYIDIREPEFKAYSDQVEKLPAHIAKTFLESFKDFEDLKTKEAVVAKDADYLETVFQCKEYAEIGYSGCLNILEKAGEHLRTASAKKLYKEAKETSFSDWFQHIRSKINFSK
ncbi:HD domain-containing protein [Candidatus Peregrinibacteria bacterium]|nr:HD domain-containing protein [Candidatus Peregrinibacteria bacterium]